MDLFDQRGYTQVTVDEIAAAAGVSPRTFYRYFGNKEGLFIADTYATVGWPRNLTPTTYPARSSG